MDNGAPRVDLTERFEQALTFACQLHRGQTRKASGVPYVSHLLSVAALVLEAGGDEDLAIAALLHDAVEDRGGRPVLAQIEARFGPRVAQIVEGCSDSFAEDPTQKAPWKERKQDYLERLASEPLEVLCVSLADKLHNARSTLLDYRHRGEALWQAFNAGREQQLWYYQQLAELFRQRLGARPLVGELERVVAELRGTPLAPTPS